MTYNKPKKTIEVIGRHGIDVTLADGDNASSASYAFAEFMRDDAMHIKVADITEGGSAFSGADSVIVPYHEVGAVVVDMVASSVTRPDPYGCEEEGNPDCSHSDLGELMYCGNASSKAIVSGDGTYDEGVQENYRNGDAWLFMRTSGLWACTGAYIAGVFDGQTVIGETISENSMAFGEYLSIVVSEDVDTGDPIVDVSELTGASHYALYTSADGQHSDLGCLYYCGGLQNGIIIASGGTHDDGTIETNTSAWVNAIHQSEQGYFSLVSNGSVTNGEVAGEHTIMFGDTRLEDVVDPETGDDAVTIFNAPSHYAIYYNPGTE